MTCDPFSLCDLARAIAGFAAVAGILIALGIWIDRL